MVSFIFTNLTKMQFLLTEKEMSNFVTRKRLDEESNKVHTEKLKVEMLLKFIKDKGLCDLKNGEYCDDCPIATLNNKFRRKICSQENYSK